MVSKMRTSKFHELKVENASQYYSDRHQIEELDRCSLSIDASRSLVAECVVNVSCSCLSMIQSELEKNTHELYF